MIVIRMLFGVQSTALISFQGRFPFTVQAKRDFRRVVLPSGQSRANGRGDTSLDANDFPRAVARFCINKL